jgi:hypothetical protein
MAGSVPVVIASDQSAIPTTLPATVDTTATGAITANGQAVEVATDGIYATLIQILGTFVGTLAFEFTVDNWTTAKILYVTPRPFGGMVTSATAVGSWVATTGSYKKIRVRATSWTSGTANIILNASIAQNDIGAYVHGGSDVGAAPILPPVGISGVDGGGLKRSIITDTTGRITLDPTSVPSAVSDVQISTAPAQPVRLIGQRTWQAPFTDVSASTLSSTGFTQIYKSAGITLSQASGALAVVASATANEEWLAVSTRSWTGVLSQRQKTTLSQRIANNNFWVILGDKIGDNLTLTVNSSTSVTVSSVPGSWSSANVGQSMFMGAVGGLAGMTPGRFAIASVSGSNITFTVPAMGISSGTTTCSLFGWNHAKLLYTSTTATNAAADTQYQGWASGDTTLTVNTTATGHLTQILSDGRDVYFEDALVASSATPAFTTRGSRYSLVPDETVPLFLYLWVQNGTTNPASTTTWTLQEIAVESFPNNPVFIAGNKQMGQQAPAPVTINSGTITTLTGTTALTPGTAATNLGKAEDAASASGDTGVFALAVRRDLIVASASATGDYNEIACNKFGAILTAPFEKNGRGYRAASSFTVAASATDIWDLFGNATTSVLVTKVRVSGIQTTGGVVDVGIIKRSTANSAGTRVAQTVVPLDAADSAANSTPGHYTANPTTGTTIGYISRQYGIIPAAATPIAGNVIEFDFASKAKGVLLSGTAQGISVNLNSVTVTGGTIIIEVEWIEFV